MRNFHLSGDHTWRFEEKKSFSRKLQLIIFFKTPPPPCGYRIPEMQAVPVSGFKFTHFQNGSVHS